MGIHYIYHKLNCVLAKMAALYSLDAKQLAINTKVNQWSFLYTIQFYDPLHDFSCIRVRFKIFFSYLSTKKLSQGGGSFVHQKQIFKLVDKKIFITLHYFSTSIVIGLRQAFVVRSA